MRVLVISDLHAPFHHPAALDFLADLRREFKPQEVVCIGDEHDAHAWSRHDPSPEAPGPADEIALARAALAPFFKLFPRVKVCRSNHGERAVRAGARSRLAKAWIREPKDVLGAPRGWEWAQEWIVDGVLYLHGDGVSGRNGALEMAERQRCCVVIGHLHSWAGIAYSAGPRDTIWGMNVGCLIDPDSIAFHYAAVNPRRPTLGTGYVDGGIPGFVPLRGN